jgi:C4-dicarboxylate-specific signal transduction histidine kinase
MLRFSREDLISGRVRWTDLWPAEWRDHYERAVAEIKATGALQPFRKECLRKDGSRVPVMIGGAMFEEGGSEGVAFVLDLSEQKRAEEALQKAQSELAHVARVTTLGEMTASIAHEIKQPLAAIVTNANAGLRWLATDLPNLEETRQAIRRIIRDGNRAGDVVSRIMALFKKAPPAEERIEINALIQEVLTLMQGEAQRNQVTLQAEFANDLPLLIGDRIQLQQVILNLLVNAIQAVSAVSDGRRELCVSSLKVTDIDAKAAKAITDSKTSIQPEPTQVLIAVRDSGPGLDPQRLNHLFDAFYTTRPQGLGMGLTISRSIVEAHGGRLRAKANTPRGAVFEFTLPIRDATQA